MTVCMARVLISEPEHDLRLLAEQWLIELDHEPLALGGRPGIRVDVLLLAASPGAAVVAHALRRLQPGLAIVSCGVTPAGRDIRALGPVAHLVKPYTIEQLDRALARALAPLEHDLREASS